MSHFTVTIKLTAARLKRHEGNVEEAIAEILAPFEESPEKKTFLAFKDMEDEYRKEYETEKTKRLRNSEGKTFSRYDKKFRVSSTHKNPFPNPEYIIPSDYEEIELPFTEVYPTFENFCEKYHGSKIDSGTRKFGYWYNPNAKWDWYSIGGRWTGFYPLKAKSMRILGRPGAFDNTPVKGHGDVVRVSDIDMDLVEKKTRESAEEFYEAWLKWLQQPVLGYDAARSRALDLGLVRVEKGPATGNHNEVVIPWTVYNTDGKDERSWTDIVTRIDRDAFMKKYIRCFNPIVTYAALDEEGVWHSPGNMGWFGCSDDTPENYVVFHNEFMQRFIKTAAFDDVFVLVDCHI